MSNQPSNGSSILADLRRANAMGVAPPQNWTTLAADEIERLRAALKVTKQAILEFRHAQESGPGWYTRGVAGMYAQVQLWLERGSKAARDALGPYDENGQYLAEKSPAETPVRLSGECICPTCGLRHGSASTDGGF